MPRDLALGQDAGESETADPSQLRRLAEREQPASVERSSEFLPYALFRLGFGIRRLRAIESGIWRVMFILIPMARAPLRPAPAHNVRRPSSLLRRDESGEPIRS
jgi:hypothetical protein